MKNTTTMTKENTVKEEIGKCRKAFNWHNGLMIEEQLNILTHKDFVLQESYLYNGFSYINPSGESVRIDSLGNIVETDVYLPALFEKRAKERLIKTDKMFDKFSSLKQFM